MFAIALWAIDALPAGARVATHWGMDGRPNAWTGKWAGLLFIPVLSCVLWVVWSSFPQGFWMPGKVKLPEHARRAVFTCVLLCETGVEIFMALNAVRFQ